MEAETIEDVLPEDEKGSVRFVMPPHFVFSARSASSRKVEVLVE